MLRVIGIDFGTSTTYMYVKRYNDANNMQPLGGNFTFIPVIFNHGANNGNIATIIRENADGTFDCGESADMQLEGSVVYRAFKMKLESEEENERSTARRMTKEFFKYLHECYHQQSSTLGAPGDTIETLVSYPVKWKQETRDFMIQCAVDAGFQNVKGIDEATSAVFTVLCQQMDSIQQEGLVYANKPGYLLIVDMGAGTTDLAVCRYSITSQDGNQMNMSSISTEVIACWPMAEDSATFGGREIDSVLAKYVQNYLEDALAPAMVTLAEPVANQPGGAKAWKEKQVSVFLNKNEPVTTCAYITSFPVQKKFPPIDREKFESLIDLHEFSSLVQGCLDLAGEAVPDFSEKGLDLVILTGGHSGWYFTRDIIDGTMPEYVTHPSLKHVRENPKRVIMLPNPQATVALGMVYSKLPYRIEEYEEPKFEEILEATAVGNSKSYFEYVSEFIRQSSELENLIKESKLLEICKFPSDETCFSCKDEHVLMEIQQNGLSFKIFGKKNYFITWQELLGTTLFVSGKILYIWPGNSHMFGIYFQECNSRIASFLIAVIKYLRDRATESAQPDAESDSMDEVYFREVCGLIKTSEYLLQLEKSGKQKSEQLEIQKFPSKEIGFSYKDECVFMEIRKNGFEFKTFNQEKYVFTWEELINGKLWSTNSTLFFQPKYSSVLGIKFGECGSYIFPFLNNLKRTVTVIKEERKGSQPEKTRIINMGSRYLETVKKITRVTFKASSTQIQISEKECIYKADSDRWLIFSKDGVRFVTGSAKTTVFSCAWQTFIDARIHESGFLLRSVDIEILDIHLQRKSYWLSVCGKAQRTQMRNYLKALQEELKKEKKRIMKEEGLTP